MRTKQQILASATSGWELFPMSSKEDADISRSMIYRAMEEYAEEKLKNSENPSDDQS